MKLLFLTDNFPPEVNAPATRTFEHCREWARRGVEVTVITCAPNFPSGKLHAGFRNRPWQEEHIDGIRVIRVWSYIAANAGFARRILDYISFAIAAFVAGLFVRTDLIVATSPQFFTAIAGYASGFVKRRPWVMEVRDLWPESIAAVGAAAGNEWWFRLLEKTELFLYRRAARVVVVTDAFRRDLMRRGIPENKIFTVTNGVLAANFSRREKDAALIGELGLEGKTVVGYIGTHGMAHNLNFILDCSLKTPTDVHFLFVGGGAMKDRLTKRVAAEGIPNVTMLPAVAKSEIARYLSVVDIALVPLRRSDTFKTVIPSKIFESASMGKPILLGVEGESKNIIERYRAGHCYVPEDEASFLATLHVLHTDREAYGECRRNCAELAKDYDRNRLAGRMLTILESLVAPEKRTKLRMAPGEGESLPKIRRLPSKIKL